MDLQKYMVLQLYASGKKIGRNSNKTKSLNINLIKVLGILEFHKLKFLIKKRSEKLNIMEKIQEKF